MTDKTATLYSMPTTQRSFFANRPVSLLSNFYLSGRIGEPEEYVEWFDIIRNANEGDTIKIHINSPGGDLFTAIQFMRVLADCRCTVITSVEGACMSAATLIFLMSDLFEISDHSSFMFHNYSGGVVGKGGEMHDQTIHEYEWSKKIFADCYGGFLSKKEIVAMTEGKDFWMSGDEVASRLEKRSKKAEKEHKRLAKLEKTLKPTEEEYE